MTLSRITLESFEADDTTPREESSDYARGYNDGAEQAQKAQAVDLTRAATEISGTLADMTFGYAEARGHLLESMRPLLAQVAENILPAIAHETFSAHLIETISSHFNDATRKPIEISIAPEALDAISTVLDLQTGDFIFVADPEIITGQAVLRNESTDIIIDFPALLEALQAALNGFEATERIASNE